MDELMRENLERHYVNMLGMYDSLPQGSKDFILEATAYFHIRDGRHGKEWGRIEIKPSELRDLIAYALTLGGEIKRLTETEGALANG